MWGSTLGLFFLIAFWVWRTEDRGFPYLNTAWVFTTFVAVAMMIPVLWYMKRRPADQVATWGEAMLGATYVFALLFWVYGVVPHQFLVFADSELNWRSDRRLVGPRLPMTWFGTEFPFGQRATVGGQEVNEGIVSWALPFELNYRIVRDIIAVVIYGLYLAFNIAVFSMWQRRGDAAPSTDLEAASRYGRPIVKRERAAETAGV